MKFAIHTAPKAPNVATDPVSASQWRAIGTVSARTAYIAAASVAMALDVIRDDARGSLFLDDGERYLYVRQID